ncbi:transcription elongation factor Spt5 [Nanoarchaeota archaeon]
MTEETPKTEEEKTETQTEENEAVETSTENKEEKTEEAPKEESSETQQEKVKEEQSEEKDEIEKFLDEGSPEKTEQQPKGKSGDHISDILVDKDAKKPEPEEEEQPKKEEAEEDKEITTNIFALRTTANREDQVMDFVASNAAKKKINVYSVIRPHGMRGYIFLEADTKSDAEQAAQNIPYARGILAAPISYSEIEHMLEQVKKEVNIKKEDIAEIISGPFKREQCKVKRIDKGKEEVVVELLEAAVPIPITVKMDAIKIIRREGQEEDED